MMLHETCFEAVEVFVSEKIAIFDWLSFRLLILYKIFRSDSYWWSFSGTATKYF